MSDTHRKELFVVRELSDDYERHFLSDELEKDVMYYRKQKLQKICSKLAM